MKTFLIALFLAFPLFGQLVWETKSLEFKPMSGEGSLIAKYKFHNSGSKPVTVLGINTSCGCTTVSMAKKSYAPGEQGEVEVKFIFGGRRGPQIKTIVVLTDDPKEASTALVLQADILELVKVRPSYLYWKKGADKKSQTLNLKMTSSVTAKVVSVSSNNPNFKIELQQGDDEKEYEVSVTPLDTTTPVLATLTIQTDYPAGKPESYKAYAQVK